MAFNLIYTHDSGGKIYQGGKKDIRSAIEYSDLDAIVFAAYEFQPKIRASRIIPIYAPLDDNFDPSPEDAKYTIKTANEAAEKVAKLVRQGKKVLVSCQAGWNRSGIITALSIKKLTNYKGNEIITLIKLNRRFALSNPAFQTFIRKIAG